jgi:RHS repeat-associated protein
MSVTNYIWHRDSVRQEADSVGSATVHFNRRPHDIDNLISEQRAKSIRIHTYDGLGSTAELTDATETVTDVFRYSAFGREIKRSGTTPTQYKWVGRSGYQAERHGVYCIRQRHYSSAMVRWLSPDPIFSSNLYQYADNNPIIAIDPSGLLAAWPISVNMVDEGQRDKTGSCPQWHSKLKTKVTVPASDVKKLGLKSPFSLYVFQQFTFVCSAQECRGCDCECGGDAKKSTTTVWELLGGKAKTTKANPDGSLDYAMTDGHGTFKHGLPDPISIPEACEDRVCNEFSVSVHMRFFLSLPAGAKATWSNANVPVDNGCLTTLSGHISDSEPKWWPKGKSTPWSWIHYSYSMTNQCCSDAEMTITPLTVSKSKPKIE